MKKILEFGNKYMRHADWKDLAMIKFCLFAIGMLAGCNVSGKHKKIVMAGSAAVFLVTYIPLMTKFITVITKKEPCEAKNA